MRPVLKSTLKTTVKLLIAAALIYWLIASGRLSFKELRIFIDRPSVLAINVTIWVVCYVLLGTLRWFLLLRGLSVKASFLPTVRLQMIGFFFNTVMPGAVSGDVIKAVYVIREQKERGKTRAMLTILLDRIVGLVGLFVVAGVALIFGSGDLWTNPTLTKLAYFVWAVLAAVAVGLSVVFFPFKEGRDPFLKILSAPLPGLGVVRQVYEALRSYRGRPAVLGAALGITIVIHCAGLCFAWYLTLLISGAAADPATFVVIYSTGLLVTAIPLAPGGLGIGHIAFDRLFHMAGLNNGANVFNVMILGQLSLHLLGVIPYLAYRRRGEPAATDVMEAAAD
jgi:uncharacterized membrane protein YbhN (UPF0104 family)